MDEQSNEAAVNTLSSDGFEEKFEEEDSWEENRAQRSSLTDEEQTKTSRWREDWNEEEEKEIKKMNQRTTINGDGNNTSQNKGGNRGSSSAVQDWPWAEENAPLQGEYRPWPGNPPARAKHAAGRITPNQAGKGSGDQRERMRRQPRQPEQQRRDQREIRRGRELGGEGSTNKDNYG
jgi:hypothetical protein